MIGPSGGIPRYRPFDGPALFSQGFRPFFLGAGLWALVAIALWLAWRRGALSIPTAFDPPAWHAHEMIFGFAAAVVAGFALTAIPNWTGRMPLQGRPLMMLFGSWLAGRLAVAVSAAIGAGPAAALDLCFLAAMLVVVGREVLAGRKWRNLALPAGLSGLFVANLLTHLEVAGHVSAGSLGQRLGIATIVLLIGAVGGRVIPSFTRNWLAKRGEARMPASLGRFDRACLALTFAGLVGWVVGPESRAAAMALFVAGIANAIRLGRWRVHRTLGEPLVWSLHLGFAWVPLGLCLLAIGVAAPDLVPPTAGLHALTVGAIASMTLAMMARTILGQTGRRPGADRATGAVFVLIALAAVARVAAALAPDAQGLALPAAGLLWSGAFGLFVLRYGPMLLGR